jgi:hypothetical protein
MGEKRRRRAGAGACGNGAEPPDMTALAAHEQSVGPETVGKAPLTGLSFKDNHADGPQMAMAE